jgi:hypothetical protein
MAADPNIFAQYLQPVRSMNERLAALDQREMAGLQLEGQRQQNAFLGAQRASQLDALNQSKEDENVFRGLASQAPNTNVLIDALERSGSSGLLKRAQELRKNLSDYEAAKVTTRKAEGEDLVKRLGVLKTLAGGVMANPTMDAAMGALEAFERFSGLQATEARRALSQLTTPEQIKMWAAAQSLDADKLLPTIQNRDTGGAVQTIAVNPVTGLPQVTGAVQKTATPDAVMVDRRTREEGEKNRGVQLARLNYDKSKDAAAGVEGTSPAPVLGVPKPAVLPWANQTNPRDANKVKASQAQAGAKEVEKDTEEARTAATMAADAKRFLELNQSVDTGSVVDKFSVGRAVQGLGDKYSEMQSITARLAPAMRQPGSGATSDYDARQFERATVGVDKPAKTNANIANAVIAKAQMAQDYAQFRQTYLEQNGTLVGADRYWKQYADANPIFKPGDKDFTLNDERTSWRDHFSGKQKPATPPPPSPAAPAGKPAGQPAKVTSDADYNALPSGTMFVGPDGKTRRKP